MNVDNAVQYHEVVLHKFQKKIRLRMLNSFLIAFWNASQEEIFFRYPQRRSYHSLLI